ncbi:MAG TPA: Fe-Mn family superoxide dismutase [Gaiellaceae bacterium]|jgi:Fe-Mn family superoxide dismutase
MPIPPGRHTLGPANGTLSVRTGRTGAAAVAGHDLLLHVTDWEATVEAGADAADTTIVLEADGGSLRVQEGTGGMQPLGEEEKESIHQTLDDEILKRQKIRFRSTSVDVPGDGSRLRVRGELTLNDATAPVSFVLSAAPDGSLNATVVVRQSDWGMTPYSALFGALRVADEVEVEVDAGLQPRERAPLPPYRAVAPRPLRPELLELDGISAVAMRAHHRLYEGEVRKRNELLARLMRGQGDVRALKLELAHVVGQIKSHETYFAQLGGAGGDPSGAIAGLVARDFGSVEAWRADLRATALAGRGWAWTAYDWDEGRLRTHLGDGQGASPIWNATPLVALDVHEHAYVLDFQTDRAGYVDAFLANLDWAVVNGWVEAYGIPQSR